MKCSARMIGLIYEVPSTNVKRPAELHSANVIRPAGLLLCDPRVAADLVLTILVALLCVVDVCHYVARSYTSSPDSPFSLISSLTLPNHLLLDLPPLYFHSHPLPSFLLTFFTSHARYHLPPSFPGLSLRSPLSLFP